MAHVRVPSVPERTPSWACCFLSMPISALAALSTLGQVLSCPRPTLGSPEWVSNLPVVTQLDGRSLWVRLPGLCRSSPDSSESPPWACPPSYALFYCRTVRPFSKQEYWNGLSCLPPRIFLTQGSNLHWHVPALAGGFLTTSATGEALMTCLHLILLRPGGQSKVIYQVGVDHKDRIPSESSNASPGHFSHLWDLVPHSLVRVTVTVAESSSVLLC